MTKFIPRSLPAVVLALVGFLTSCEQPALKEKEEPLRESGVEASSAVTAVPPVAEEEKTTAESAPDPAVNEATPRPEPTFPELAVFREGETIVIEGALKSRMQVARIAEEMQRDFPGTTIENRLKVEAHRFPVGWGNRVGIGYLVPFFQEVKNPYVGYEEGVVILKGEVGRGGLKRFQELAVNVFAGMHLKDIRNEMVEAGR